MFLTEDEVLMGV